MLGDSELDRPNALSVRYNTNTLLSGSNSPNFSAFGITPDILSEDSGFSDLLHPDTTGLDTDSLLNSVINGFASGFSGMGGAFGLNINNSNIDGDGSSGSTLDDLLNLIMGIVLLPMRFGYLFGALMEGTGALALGVGGIAQSVALGTKDIYLLIIAILQIIFKYFLCIMSFIMTTIGGCLFIHVFTLFFVMIYLFIMALIDGFNESTGIDLSPIADKIFEQIKWPDSITKICYSCFGTPVKLREVLADVGVLEDIGNMISYDFNNTMPQYMKPAIPLGTDALGLLDKAMN
jgi:hypothetical protein